MIKKYSLKSLGLKLITGVLTCLIFLSGLMSLEAVDAAQTVDISKQVKLKWIVIGLGDQADKKLVESSINKYLKDKINAVLDITTFSWGEFDQRMNIYIAAGEQYDINFTSSWTTNYRKMSEMNVYKDLTGMLDKYAPKTKALLGDKILKSAGVNGRIYALPVYNYNIVNSYGILLNKKLVEKYKIDTAKITKLQDMEPYLKKIKASESGIAGFYPFDSYLSGTIINTLNYDRLLYNSPAAVKRDGKSTAVVNLYETGDAKALFTMMNKWYKAGYIPKSAEATQNYYDNNKSKIFAMYSSITPTKSEEFLNSYSIDMVPVILNKPSITTESVSGAMHAISAMCKNPERALMLLELVNTDPKLSNLINYGVEEIHYKKTGTNSISQTSRGMEKYNPGSPWVFGNQTITYPLPGYTSKAVAILKDNVKNAVASPLAGFTFDSQPVAAEITKTYSITDKYINDLCIGKVNPTENLNKMNTELKKGGVQKIFTEMQLQVDRFVKNGR
ncbi:hypothetical protein CLHUN_36210 [Ruminiclostridium hungatei]|uniref:DUF3502 domain-containing protein n=1 Tax=Ruminiclostridium hungatei TaxID=48256 RepID=A0A1V4SG60_RUMHU|nr:ABC transporter substrate-binding protein [Ruminiclostridium hungatei]OPX42496.1 hypothetical protein CLHUN_36210 [Ruminiclostridium hungatei]